MLCKKEGAAAYRCHRDIGVNTVPDERDERKRVVTFVLWGTGKNDHRRTGEIDRIHITIREDGNAPGCGNGVFRQPEGDDRITLFFGDVGIAI